MKYMEVLSLEENNALLYKAQKGDLKARDLFIEHNQRLVAKIAHKYEYNGISATFEDLVQIGNVGLLNAINTFKFEKSVHFSTYATRLITNEIILYLRKEQRWGNEVSEYTIGAESGEYQSILESTEDPKQNADQWIDKILLAKAIECLSEKYKYVINMMYVQDKSEKEIAAILGCSKSNVGQIRLRAVKKIRESMFA